jgi:hypothetical protein
MSEPQPSRVATINVPIIGSNNPATLIRAPKGKPIRLMIRNVGGVLCFLAHDVQDLATFSNASANSYRLPAGQVDVFVVMPEQAVYAVAQGAQGLISIAISEALPAVYGES